MNIGYACLTYAVPGVDYKTCLLKSASPGTLESIVAYNLDSLEKAVMYNQANDIRLFRISSGIIPLASHPGVHYDWAGRFGGRLNEIGKSIKAAGLRVSMHPGQYTVLNTPDPGLLQRSIADIRYHACFLDALGVSEASKIILHIGGAYGDKEAALARFAAAYVHLDESMQKRIVIENDEKLFHIAEVLETGRSLGIPVVFDALHHRLNPPEESSTDGEWIRLCGETWQVGDGAQKIHYSQQAAAGRPGAHSAYIGLEEFIAYMDSVGNPDIDVMLETKDKNVSALKCILGTQEHLPASVLEREWARYQYLVLSRSQKAYEQICERIKGPDTFPPREFYRSIDRVLPFSHPPAQLQAARHIWDCFTSTASNAERLRVLRALDEYRAGQKDIASLKSSLCHLAEKYQIEYLLESYYFCY